MTAPSMTAPGAHAAQESLLSLHLRAAFPTGFILGHACPTLAAPMALGSRHPHVSCLCQKGQSNSRGPGEMPGEGPLSQKLGLLPTPRAPCNSVGGGEGRCGSPKENWGAVPKTRGGDRSRENRGCLLCRPVLGNGAARGQHPPHEPPRAPGSSSLASLFWTFRKCFLDIVFP